MSKWEKLKISEIGTVCSGGTPSTNNPNYWGEGILFVTPMDLSKAKTAFITNTLRTITNEGLKKSSANLLPKGTIVMSSRAPIGYFSIITNEFVTNQGCKSIVCFEGQNELFHYYNSLFNIELIKRYGEGTTFLEISKKDFEEIELLVPSDPKEQQRIADILLSADKVIETTEQVIEKYEAIKQGMLHDLFTRGVDSNGKLRPIPKEAPELYKSSELGLIPKDWEIELLSELGLFKNGINKDKSQFGFGSLFINISDAYLDKILEGKLGRLNAYKSEIDDYSLNYDDIIFVRSSVKPEGVGYNTIFKSASEPVLFCGFMIRFRLNDFTEYNADFLNSYFRYYTFRQKLITYSTVSANTNINQESLKKLIIIKPQKSEQIEIVKRIEGIDLKVASEKNILLKYKAIKQGLMTDLLGGKKIDNNSNKNI